MHVHARASTLAECMRTRITWVFRYQEDGRRLCARERARARGRQKGARFDLGENAAVESIISISTKLEHADRWPRGGGLGSAVAVEALTESCAPRSARARVCVCVRR